MPLLAGQSERGEYVGVGAEKVVAVVAGFVVVDVAAEDDAVGFMSEYVPSDEPASCMFFPPTAPPTAAPTITNAMIAATTRNVLTFMPKIIRGGVLSFSYACLPV